MKHCTLGSSIFHLGAFLSTLESSTKVDLKVQFNFSFLSFDTNGYGIYGNLYLVSTTTVQDCYKTGRSSVLKLYNQASGERNYNRAVC